MSKIFCVFYKYAIGCLKVPAKTDRNSVVMAHLSHSDIHFHQVPLVVQKWLASLWDKGKLL